MPVSSEYTMHLPASVVIGVSSTSEFVIEDRERLLLGAYLPGVKVTDGIDPRVNSMVYHIESKRLGLRQSDDAVEVRDTWNGRFSMDLPHLLYGIARASWLRKNLFSAHAACIARSDGLVTLMPGHSGTGKSTVTLALAKAYDHRVFSGNTTLIDVASGRIEAVAGTHTMTLKTDDFQRSGIEASSFYEYGDRTAFQLSPEYYAQARKLTVGRIALLQLSDTRRMRRSADPASALHQLYPYLLDTVHQDVITSGGSGLYVGPSAPENRLALLRGLRDALKRVPVRQVMGSSGQVAEELATV